jgi:hypothetical protein
MGVHGDAHPTFVARLIRPGLGCRGRGVGIAAPLPVETFFAKPDYGGAALSPSGRYVAAIAPIEGHQGLVVMDLNKDENRYDPYGRVERFLARHLGGIATSKAPESLPRPN